MIDGTEAESGETVAIEAPVAVVTLNFADYVATDAHEVYAYDAYAAAVQVSTSEIASVDGVLVTAPEESAEAEAVSDAAEEIPAVAEEDILTEAEEEIPAEVEVEIPAEVEVEIPAEPEPEAAAEPEAVVLVITGDGEYVVNGTAYIVENLTLPVAVIEGDGSDAEVDSDKEITISSASGEAVLPDAEPVFTEMDMDTSEYEDILSLFA